MPQPGRSRIPQRRDTPADEYVYTRHSPPPYQRSSTLDEADPPPYDEYSLPGASIGVPAATWVNPSTMPIRSPTAFSERRFNDTRLRFGGPLLPDGDLEALRAGEATAWRGIDWSRRGRSPRLSETTGPAERPRRYSSPDELYMPNNRYQERLMRRRARRLASQNM